MISKAMLAVPFAFLLLAGVRAESESAVADEASRSSNQGPQGYSQQYHYNSYPVQDGGHGGYAGLTIDVGTGLFIALGAIIVLLAVTCIVYPLINKGHDSHGSGGGGGGGGGAYRSMNLANLSEKVLHGIERVYEAYHKNQ